jgi:hypothetical protein
MLDSAQSIQRFPSYGVGIVWAAKAAATCNVTKPLGGKGVLRWGFLERPVKQSKKGRSERSERRNDPGNQHSLNQYELWVGDGILPRHRT